MFKLALSAGHGYNTSGKRCLKKLDPKQTREWTLNSRICNKIEEKLSKYEGCAILRVDDETGKKDISIRERARRANDFGADFYIAVHADAGINGKSGGGISAFCHPNGSKESFDWRDKCYKAIIQHTGLRGNRSQPLRTANFGEVLYPNCPSILIEHGFMDSKDDVPIILTDKFADQVATAYVEVIVEKAKLKKKEEKKPINEEKKPVKAEPKKETVKKNNVVLEWQKAAIKDGFKFPKYGADGSWGSECEAVAKKAICKKQLIGYKYQNLTKIVQKAIGVTVDGKFGNDTKKAVVAYQKKHKLTADGCVGLNTWKKILGV